MLPSKRYNIYPKSEENLKALISFYFDKYDLPIGNAIEKINSITSLSLNQVEYILRKLSESYEDIFKVSFKNGGNVNGLFLYGLEALTIEEAKWNKNGSKVRLAKTKEFLEYVNRTEKDLKYFEKYN